MVVAVDLPRFAVVDLETSGLSSRRHRILQIGLVLVDADGQVADRWMTHVKLRWPLQRVGPTDVHGITRATLRGAPKLDAALDELSDRIGDAMLTAHNAGFDGAFLVRAGRRNPALDFEQRLCTLRMSRRLDPDRELSHRLGDVCQRYGVDLTNAHDALADATATAGILPHLIAAHGVTEREQLDPFLDRPQQARRPIERARAALRR